MRRKQILIVEDDEVTAQMLQKLFDDRGYQTFHKSSGEGVVALLEQHQPELLLLDLGLPDQCGLELLASIRARPGIQDTKVLVLSGCSAIGAIEKAWELSVQTYLTKPLHLPNLLSAVARVMSAAPERRAI